MKQLLPARWKRPMSWGIGLFLGMAMVAQDSQPRLTAPHPIPGGFAFSVLTEANANYQIEGSTNLVDWTVRTNLTGNGQAMSVTDWEAGRSTRQYYRAKAEPVRPPVLPDSLAGLEFQGTVQTATEDFLQYGWLFGTAETQRLSFAFDHEGGLCSVVTEYGSSTHGGASDTVGVPYTYTNQPPTPTLTLYLGWRKVALTLAFDTAHSGAFRADYVGPGKGTLTGVFTLRELTIRALENNEWVPLIVGSFGGQHHYKIAVPEGQKELAIHLGQFPEPANGAYVGVRWGSPASPTRHDYLLDDRHATDSITVLNPTAGDWYILLEDQTYYTGVGLMASFSADSSASITIAPSIQEIPASGGTNQVRITATEGATWSVDSDVNWIIVTSERQGFGDATMRYTVAANPGSEARTGTVRIGGQLLTVTQAAGVGSGDLAPTTLAGRVVRITDSRGVSYSPISFVDETHFSMPADAFLPAMSGTYNYQRTDPATGQVVMFVTGAPLTGRQMTISLVFTGPTAGAFSYAAVGGGLAEYHMSGTFIAEGTH